MTLKEFKAEWDDDRDYIVAMTSGSTGKPKQIRLQKALMVESAKRTNAFFNIGPSSHLHSCIDFGYIGGKMLAVRAWTAGATITCEHPSNRPLADCPVCLPIDLLSVVPSQLAAILGFTGKIPPIRFILVGGAPLPDHLADMSRESGLNVWESYGMTETCSHIALKKAGEKWFSILPGIQVAADNRGCLAIRMGEAEFHTNDVAEFNSESEFRILGRADNVIISGAKKIHPETLEKELERELASLGLHDFTVAVTSRQDVKWGEAAVAVLETNEKPDVGTLLEKIRHRGNIEGWRIPKQLLVTCIPRTANGKIDRRALRAIFKSSVF